MKYLLDNQFAPLTFTWAFIEDSIKNIIDCLVNFQKEIDKRQNYTTEVKLEYIECNLVDALKLMEPLTSIGNIYLWLTTKSKWTAHFSNGINGADPVSLLFNIPLKLKTMGLMVICKPDIKSGTYGAFSFRLYGPKLIDYSNTLRVIDLINDGGRWDFSLSGEPLDFEDENRYKAKKLRDRFTSEMLEEYCKNFGIDLFNPDFYGTKGIIMKFPTSKKARVMSLKQAREWHKIDKLYVSSSVPEENEKTQRQKLINKLIEQGLPSYSGEPFPIASIEDFFEGNDDISSIGCNLINHPGIEFFYKKLLEIREMPEVQDILVEVSETEATDPDIWPFSERIYIITIISKEKLKELVEELQPDEIEDGWAFGKPPAAPELIKGFKVYGIWWD